MSNTSDLDQTIASLNKMLQEAKSEKSKLVITDRLLRAYGLKYKHQGDKAGGKFADLSAPQEGT